MRLHTLCAALAFSCASLPAAATVPVPTLFDFANLEWTGSANTGFLPSETRNTSGTNALAGYWRCTDGDICSSNINASGHPLGGDLKYTSGGITATAKGYYQTVGHTTWNAGTVVQDHENAYSNTPGHLIGAGLGVYHSFDNSDDNITLREKLVINFAHDIVLNGLSMRSDGHNTTNFVPDATFLLNGVQYSLAADLSHLNLIGHEFTFLFGTKNKVADQFYLGTMVVSPVPEPSSYGMLAAGLGLLGLATRWRKARA